MFHFFKKRLSPFQHESFRWFFFAQTLSLIGSWANDLARAYLVIELMGRAGALGSLLLASAIPSFLLILQGGVIVDRVDVKRLMIYTKSGLALLSLVLAAVVEFSQVEMWVLLAFALIEGCLVGLDNPAFQTLTVRLVPRSEFQQAMALNSTNFHAARMLGPLVAGGLMYFHGPSLVFLFDALSFIGVIAVLRMIDLRHVQKPQSKKQSQTEAILEGFQYFYHDRKLRYRIFQLLINICLIYPLMMVVFRAYIKQKFDLDADAFGYVFMFPALGAVLGALSFTVLQPQLPTRVLIFSIPGAIASILTLPFLPTALHSAAIMGLAGFFMYLSFASLTVSVHLDVKEEFRGRIGSLIGLCFVSIGPMMSFPIGAFADLIGFVPAIISITVTFGVGSLCLALLNRRWKKRVEKAEASL